VTITEWGWAALGASLALLVLWAVLGEVELAASSFLIVAAVCAGWLSVRKGAPGILVSRQLHPALVSEGDTVSVQLVASNDSSKTARYVLIEDEIRGLGGAHFRITSLVPGVAFTGTYEVTCGTRGIYDVGPALVSRSDPFVFTKSGGPVGAVDGLVVYPRIEHLAGLPSLHGVDPSLQATRAETVQRGGDDFFSLREYQTGDDLRRVHWPTTARRDEMMIRQFETPWEPRALVVVDPRGSVYASPEAFETAVRGAASAVHHFFEAGLGANLWAGGETTGLERNPYEAAMRALAGLQPLRSYDFAAAASRVRLKGLGGTIVIVTGTPDVQVGSAARHLTHHAGAVVLLTVSLKPIPTSFGGGGETIVSVRPGQEWSTAWMKAMPWATAGVG
jgi:uncharacterized protein (DUF58 family)